MSELLEISSFSHFSKQYPGATSQTIKWECRACLLLTYCSTRNSHMGLCIFLAHQLSIIVFLPSRCEWSCVNTSFEKSALYIDPSENYMKVRFGKQ